MQGWRVRRRWRQLVWIDRFGYSVIAGFVVTISTLVACTALVDDSPTLPSLPLPSYATTTTLPATTTTVCGPSGVPYSECSASFALHTPTDTVRSSTGP